MKLVEERNEREMQFKERNKLRRACTSLENEYMVLISIKALLEELLDRAIIRARVTTLFEIRVSVQILHSIGGAKVVHLLFVRKYTLQRTNWLAALNYLISFPTN